MKRLCNFRPAVLYPSAYALGISAFALGIKSFIIPAVLIVFMPVVTGAVYSFIKNSFNAKTILFTLSFQLALLLGFFSVSVRFNAFFGGEINGETCSVTAVFDSERTGSGERSLCFERAEFSLNGKTVKAGKITVEVPFGVKFEYGDKVKFIATVYVANERGNGSADLYAFTSGVKYECVSDMSGATVVGRSPGLFGFVRRALERGVKNGVDENNAPIVNAMLFGDKTEIKPSVISGMKYAGLAHVFAVSGLHVGFVAGIIYFLLKKIKAGRWASFAVTVGATFFYCGVCDFSPSSVRAFLMLSFYLFYRTLGIKYDMLNSIFTSALAILIFRPQYLYSYGFILSYAAVVSIAVMAGPVSRSLSFLPYAVRGDISTVLAAQIGVFPFSVAFFGYVSWISAYINLIVIPLISVVFVILAVSVVLSAVTTLYKIFLFAPNFLVGLLGDFVGKTDFSVFALPVSAGGTLVCVYCAGVLIASDVFNLKFGVKAAACTSLMIIYVVFSQLFTFGVL